MTHLDKQAYQVCDSPPPFSMVVFQLMEQSLVFIITVATILWQYTFIHFHFAL